MKYAWIDSHRREFALSELCEALKVSISGYRASKRGGVAERKGLTDLQMLALSGHSCRTQGRLWQPTHGARTAKTWLLCGQGAGREVMRENGIHARHKCRYKVTTDSRHALPVSENLLARHFTPTAPNEVWTSDITYLWTDEGWLYLAIVLDLFNREVVGWSLKPRMTADIVTDALTMAWFRRRPAPGLMHHSDRGSQYASHTFQDKLKEYGMTCSMSRKGNCRDNAPTESWFNSFKNARPQGVRRATLASLAASSFEYIEVFYNRKRQHSSLGYLSPVQFMEKWLSTQDQEKQVA